MQHYAHLQSRLITPVRFPIAPRLSIIMGNRETVRHAWQPCTVAEISNVTSYRFTGFCTATREKNATVGWTSFPPTSNFWLFLKIILCARFRGIKKYWSFWGSVIVILEVRSVKYRWLSHTLSRESISTLIVENFYVHVEYVIRKILEFHWRWIWNKSGNAYRNYKIYCANIL